MTTRLCPDRDCALHLVQLHAANRDRLRRYFGRCIGTVAGDVGGLAAIDTGVDVVDDVAGG